MMIDREKTINGLKCCTSAKNPIPCGECSYFLNRDYEDVWSCRIALMHDALALLKEQANEYEKGFNDAMLGKQELMYEGTDGKWYKKDW